MGINATLLGEIITFIIFVLITMKFVWPPIVKAMEERQQKIADGLASAERGERSLELAQGKVTKILQETKEESSNIIDQANSRAGKIVDESKNRAREAGDHIIEQSKREVDQHIETVKASLRQEVTDIAMLAAAKILEKDIDRAAHEKMLNDLIAEI